MTSTVICEKTLAEYLADKGLEKDDSTVVSLPFLPASLLSRCDLRYEKGLETIIYAQNLLEEDNR